MRACLLFLLVMPFSAHSMHLVSLVVPENTLKSVTPDIIRTNISLRFKPLSEQVTDPLERLPLEIWIQILKHLPEKDPIVTESNYQTYKHLIKMKIINKQFYELCSTSKPIREIISLSTIAQACVFMTANDRKLLRNEVADVATHKTVNQTQRDLLYYGTYYETSYLLHMLIAHNFVSPNDQLGTAYKRTALYDAIRYNRQRSFQYLMQNPCTNVNEGDSYGNTPLMAAAEYKRVEMAKALLKHPFIDLHKLKNGESALFLAHRYQSLEIANLIQRAEDKYVRRNFRIFNSCVIS